MAESWMRVSSLASHACTDLNYQLAIVNEVASMHIAIPLIASMHALYN